MTPDRSEQIVAVLPGEPTLMVQNPKVQAEQGKRAARGVEVYPS